MHNYAKAIGEHIKKCYPPECFDKMTREDLKDLKHWSEVMGQLVDYDKDLLTIKSMTGDKM